MKPHFSPEFFAGNRKRLRELYGKNTPMIITANGLLQRSSDTSFPFQQDTGFWYLTGLDVQDVVLVMLEDEEFLIAPPRTEIQDIFDGHLNWKELKATSGIRTILPKDEGWARLKSIVKRRKRIATLEPAPPFIEVWGMFTNPARAKLVADLRAINSALEFDDLRPLVAGLRLIKQPTEIAAIKKAVNITCDAFSEVQKRRYDYEYELEADLSQLFRSKGADGHAYDPIVAGGLNACSLHYGKNNERLKRGRLVLVDAGAAYDRYAADITRTWAVGRMSARQQAVLAAVNEALEYGLTLFGPELTFYELLDKVREFVGQKLVELKLIKRPTKENVYQYFPHTSHYMGLDVHDVGDYRVPMQPGMVMTLEPGIYIPEEFIGVRIEENILLNEKGPEVLSARLPRLLL